MSGSDNGAAGTHAGVEQQRAGVSPGRTTGARSASPAKRSAADMEDVSSAQPEQQKVNGGPADGETGTADSDQVMSGMTPAEDDEETQTQETAMTAAGSSITESMDTSATSFTSANDKSQVVPPAHKEPYTTEQIDKQVAKVREMDARKTDEGSRGVVISNKWLQRVLSRSTEGRGNNDYPKEAREGNVGPLDNSDIVSKGAFNGPFLKDTANQAFVPLKPGLRLDVEFSVLPYDAYGYIVGEYGYTTPTKPIVRYAHNTVEEDASVENIMYELYPPVITVRKVPQSTEDSAQVKPNRALDKLRMKQDREGRGQSNPDEAVRLVCSASDKAMNFLRRAKEAAGIPQGTKVKVWRLLDPSQVAVDKPDNTQPGVLSPPASRASSPSRSGDTKLIVDSETFSQFETGKDMESVDLDDQTLNTKYNGQRTLDAIALGYSQTILLEEQKGGPGGGEFQSDLKKGTKSGLEKQSTASRPDSAPTSGRSSPAPGGMMTRGRRRKDGRTIGTVGLSNLGNTCYMNSALQCIRSVEELAVYFLTKTYKPEINNDNPLGHHGAMANAYYGVLNGIYGGQSTSSFTPTDFKRTLGRLAPTFSGYGQQDSQEFLSFLVDALHEDLNRVKKKPYMENPDSDDNKVRDPEYIHELGETYRNNHKARNDSVAMDLFSGFYKNTMECPECQKVSVTFDPYSLLTVQLPMDVAFTHDITFVPLHGHPVIHHIDVDKNWTIKTLKEYMAKKHSTDADRLWMIEVYNHKIYKAFDDQSTLAEASIQSNDFLFMYELEDVPTNKPTTKKSFSMYGNYTKSEEDKVPLEGMDSSKADVMAVPIFNRYRNERLQKDYDAALHPLYITVTREEAKDYDKILKKVLIAVSNITSRKILTEFENDSSQNVPDAEAEAETDKEQGNEDAAGVSDHSAQSEESYVNVSRNKQPTNSQVNGESPMQIDEDLPAVPYGFMEPGYFLAPALRHQLFELKFGEANERNIHCVAMSGLISSSVRPMHDRVKPTNRRGSMQSSSSEESTTSTTSGVQVNGGDDEESDEDDPDKPDITLGGESTLSAPTVDESSEDELANNSPTLSRSNLHADNDHSRSGRRKNKNSKKGGRGKKNRRNNKKVTYGKNDRKRYGQKQNLNYFGSSPASSQSDDSPYYIQIGEGIVLDWHPEAADSLFGGDKDDPAEMRGHTYVNHDGKSGPVFYDEELEARKMKRAERKKHGINLDDCFAETSKKEVLSSDNSWYCNRCKELRQADKQLEIWTLPDILVVHMKRFGGNRSLRDKLDVAVEYPIEGLDMSDKVGLKEEGKEYIYDLFAVDNHYGGLGGGHYTAYAKNFFDDQWYEYNDSSCSKTTIRPKSAAAYLLFYRRRSDKPLGPQYLQQLVTQYRLGREEEAAESESGEGRLGGPTHSSQQHGGSSSTLAGVAVGKGTSLEERDPAANGGTGAGHNLTQKPTTTMNSIGEDGGGSERTLDGILGYGNGESSWSFQRLSGDDGDSTTAQLDGNDDSGFNSGGSTFTDISEYSSANATGTRNSPDNSMQHFDIDAGHDGAEHVEDKAVHEIHVDDPGDAMPELS
ncbi:Ubiquitin carboxyl-terminal hydrolase 12 [Lecanosticta acicola]|uniref:ubiquitinyl hydrolase 1 n=1 Tax=Lecanosticta acicola TaxID=111012 RepID=A0AAI8YUD1_9PEZI|nr:Ubiquitin carboxyl-terminal hydrolase 12 [Lecanosticta acicola]